MNKLTKVILTLSLLTTLIPTVFATREYVDRGTYIPNDEYGIIDTALYEYIKIQSGKNEVYSKDLENITSLKLSDKIYSIKSLDGLSLMEMPELYSLELDISTLDNLDEVVKLNQIKELIITKSNIEELPDNLMGLENLNLLEIHNSPLYELSRGFYKLPYLDTLVLNNLPLKKISNNIKDMDYLEHIELYSLDIEIPNAIYELSHLRTLKFEEMKLEGLSNKISDLMRLETLSLANNNFKEIPKGIYDLATLKTLNLKNNEIREVDGEIERLYNLENLDLSKNQLSTLPIQLTSLSSLKSFIVRDNPIDCLDNEFSLLKLENIFDFFEYNGIDKCKYEEDIIIETTKLVLLDNVQNNGYTNKNVTVVSNNEVYFVVDMVMDIEPRKEVTIEAEGPHKVDAVIEDVGTVASVSFVIDKKAPTIKVQGNDMGSIGFATDIAIESDEDGDFYVNGVKKQNGGLLLLSDDGDYEIYVIDIAGNKSNVLNVYIEKQEEVNPKIIDEEPNNNYSLYVIYVAFVALCVYVAYIYLRKGIELDNE